MAKKGKSSSQIKEVIKTTIIVVVVFLFGAATFLFLNKGNKDKQVEKKFPVVVKVRSKQEVTQEIESPSQLPIVTVKPKKTFVQRIPQGSGAKIAFIFDDWGYRMTNCHYLKDIQVPITVSILPNLKHTNDIVKCATVYEKDIMLHLPMEPYHNLDAYPDNYLITTKMSPSTVEKLVDDTLKKMPSVKGVNNHMGSKATEDKPLMKFLLKKFKKRGLFFVDSMTAPHHSVCAEVAEEVKIPFAQRDVFLDNVNTREAIEKQLIDLASKARHKGYAIAIGHDRTLTLQVIKDEIPILQKQGFEIVHVKELLRNQNQ